MKKNSNSAHINKIEETSDNLTGRGGLSFFVRYLTDIGIFTSLKVWLFRKVLQRLFLWRLNIKKPQVIFLDMDTMVMDNDDADVREGVGPTYKKKKGFQPLQVSW